MGVKVAKFGGSSVADVIQLNKIKEIILSDPERRYIIVSAPGKRFDGDNKITDLLYLVKTTMENMLPYDQLFQVVCDRYTAVQANLGLNIDMQSAYDKIKEKLTQNPSADYIASRGEYLNALMIADFLGFDFDVGGLTLCTAEGLVDHDAGVRKRKTLSSGTGAKQDGGHGGGHSRADGRNIGVDVLHRVVDAQTRVDVTARRVQIDLDVTLRILRLEEQQLRLDDVGHVIVNRHTEEDDAVLHQTGKDV